MERPSGYAASVAYSVDATTVFDTCSEPPRCSGKLAEKLMKRGSKDPVAGNNTPMDAPTVSSKVTSSKKSVSSRSAAPKSSMSMSGSSKKKPTSAPAPQKQKQKSTKSRDAASVSSSRSSRSRKAAYWDGGSSSSTTASTTQKKKDAPPSSSSSSVRKTSSGTNHRADAAISSRISGSSKISQQPSRDPVEYNPLAIVPMNHHKPRDPPPANCSLSTASCTSSEDEHGMIVLCDPPSTCSDSFNNDANHDWREYAEEDDEESRTRLDTIESASESSETEFDQEEETYYTEETGTRSSRSSNAGGELVVADRGKVDNNGELIVAKSRDSSVDARALVHVDNNNDEQALVEAPGRYLATAVDNNYAVVPMNSAIYEAYDHTFVTCPEHLRFRFLYTFLKKNMDKKIMIFFSTTNSARFHAKLLGHFHIPVLTMHSRRKREDFINTFFKFSDLDEGILCATDAAGRDLDIPPSVDWVIQFEPPDDPSEYILRVARISCDSDRVGRSLLFLNPGEMGFLKYYHSAAIPVSEFEIPKLAEIQANIEYHVNENERLSRYARDAYGSFLIAYASHGFRDVYNVHDLNKNDVATAFGLVSLPIADDDDDDSRYNSGDNREPDRTSSREQRKNSKWQSEKKTKSKTWMKGEKSWPHCQIKYHPKFKEGGQRREEEFEEEGGEY